jgi:Tol biopolymer transport system component
VDLKTGKVTTLVEATNGIVRDPEVHFDGKRIIFSMRRQINEDFHIWEINTDGTGLRQLTRATNVSDVDPLYLPDDRIAFT